MDLCEIAALHQTLTTERPTMSNNQPANPLANLNIYHLDQEPKSFQLIYEGRVLDANVYHDWILAGRCLRYAEQTYPPTGLNRFQIWVNWTEQRVPTDEVEVADTAAMAALWNDLALTPRLVRSRDSFDHNAELTGCINENPMASVNMAAELIPGTKLVIKNEVTPTRHNPIQLKMQRLHEQAVTPTFGTDGAACFDIYAILPGSENAVETFYPHAGAVSATVETGWAFEVPVGWVMKVYSRSGQGFKDNTRLANCVGIIDSDYRGPLRVKLTRDDGCALVVRQFDRVAQAMLVRVPAVEFVEVDELSKTVRGDGAYGSTGR